MCPSRAYDNGNVTRIKTLRHCERGGQRWDEQLRERQQHRERGEKTRQQRQRRTDVAAVEEKHIIMGFETEGSWLRGGGMVSFKKKRGLPMLSL